MAQLNHDFICAKQFIASCNLTIGHVSCLTKTKNKPLSSYASTPKIYCKYIISLFTFFVMRGIRIQYKDIFYEKFLILILIDYLKSFKQTTKINLRASY